MNRRNFLRSLIVGGVATAAARTFPFRVFNFPKEVKPVNVAPRLSKEVLDLWRQRLEVMNLYGSDVEAEWWMHPKQLAALKELGFGSRHIEVRVVEPPMLLFGSSASTLFGIPIKECPYFRPDAKPVLMAPFTHDIRVSVADMADFYSLTSERPRNPFPHSPGF